MHRTANRLPILHLVVALTAVLLSACAVNPVPTPGTTAALENDNSAGDRGGGADAGKSSVEDTGATATDAWAPPSADAGASADVGATDAAPLDGWVPADGGQQSGDVQGSADVTGAADAAGCKPSSPLKVLFLGNSYTFYNDLPKMLQTLSDKEGNKIVTDAVVKGGWTLGAKPNSHSADPQSLAKLQEKAWDVVVLQEQSQIPTIPAFKTGTMIPGAKKLVSHLRQVNQCAKVALFLTWGRKKGGKQCAGSQCSAPFKDFGEMQDALTAAYNDVAKQVQGFVVPVGEVWRASIEAGGPDLFDGDGSHPSLAGSYAAALTFYGSLTQKPPASGWRPQSISEGDGKALLKAVVKVLK